MVQSRQRAELELRRGPRLTAVAVDLDARLVPRPILHPRLGLPVREGQRDERRPEIVHPNGTPSLALLEENGPHLARELEMVAELVRQVLGRDWDAALRENWILRRRLGVRARLPSLKGCKDFRVQRPSTRVVRLVLVQRHDTVREIDVLPGQRRSLTTPETFAREHAVHQAMQQWHLLASEQPPILLGVEPRQGLWLCSQRLRSLPAPAPRKGKARRGSR